MCSSNASVELSTFCWVKGMGGIVQYRQCA